MLHLIRAEWLKLTRRPLTWVLLAVFLLLLLLQSLSQFVFVLMGPGMVAQVQYAEFQRRAVFPGLFGGVFSHINGLGGIFAVILAAGAMGSEYSWGTLRTHLSRYPSRPAFLLAKIITLLLLLLVGMLIALVVGALLGLALGSVGLNAGVLPEGVGVPDTGTLLLLPLALLRALYVLLPYVLLTISCCVVGRSLIMGLAGGLLLLVFEAGVGTLATFSELGGIWLALYNLMIVQNITTLTVLNNHSFGLRPEDLVTINLATLPSPLQATLVVACYSAVFLATALYYLRKRDVGGPN
ncbi:MAG TPA: ABC transporter permease [Roseiflexaceae bacterium]|nr:ABC transporter permease [Roseiflexaceae bacterium]